MLGKSLKILKSKILHKTFKIKPNQAQALHTDAQEPVVFLTKFRRKRMELSRVMTENVFG
mgnify:CR=1 FL=1